MDRKLQKERFKNAKGWRSGKVERKVKSFRSEKNFGFFS
jgi:hypothetical protein